MLLISKKLLEQELKNKPDILTDSQKLYYMQIEKEIFVLEKIDITLCNMRGNVNEVQERLNNSEIHFATKGEYERINESKEVIETLRQLYLNHKKLLE